MIDIVVGDLLFYISKLNINIKYFLFIYNISNLELYCILFLIINKFIIINFHIKLCGNIFIKVSCTWANNREREKGGIK